MLSDFLQLAGYFCRLVSSCLDALQCGEWMIQTLLTICSSIPTHGLAAQTPLAQDTTVFEGASPFQRHLTLYHISNQRTRTCTLNDLCENTTAAAHHPERLSSSRAAGCWLAFHRRPVILIAWRLLISHDAAWS